MINSILTALHLAPQSFPDDYLATVVPIHAGAAMIAAVILCPGAMFACKGSRLHKIFGYLVQVAATVLVISSFFLLYDTNLTEIIVNATVFPRGEYNTFYLILISFTFSYYSYSAVRVWYRVPEDGRSEVTSNWIDWGLAALAIFTGLSFLTTSIYTLGANNPLSIIYLNGSILLLAFAFFDVYTFFFPPSASRFPWWMLHMAKMMLLWFTLVRFIIFRVVDLDASEFVMHQIISLVVYVFVVATIAISLRRKFSSA